MLVTGVAQGIGPPLHHGQHRAVGGHALLPDARIGGEAVRVVENPYRRAVSEDQRRGYAGGQLDRGEVPVLLAHLPVGPVRVGGEFGGVHGGPGAVVFERRGVRGTGG